MTDAVFVKVLEQLALASAQLPINALLLLATLFLGLVFTLQLLAPVMILVKLHHATIILDVNSHQWFAMITTPVPLILVFLDKVAPSHLLVAILEILAVWTLAIQSPVVNITPLYVMTTIFAPSIPVFLVLDANLPQLFAQETSLAKLTHVIPKLDNASTTVPTVMPAKELHAMVMHATLLNVLLTDNNYLEQVPV